MKNYSKIVVAGDTTQYVDTKRQLHRTDGPAVSVGSDCYVYYFINGKLHNLNGPAFIFEHKYKHYYKNGIECPEFRFYNGVISKCPDYLKL